MAAAPAKHHQPNQRREIGLLIETSGIYGREVVAGVAAYQRTHGPWSIFLEMGGTQSQVQEFMLAWKGDGILCRWTNPDFAKLLKKRGIALVDLNESIPAFGPPRVSSDMRAIGRLAAEHLIERGFRNIAFCGFRSVAWSTQRREGVVETVGGLSNLCGLLETDLDHRRKEGWIAERKRLADWVNSLPKPVGIVAVNDVKGYQVLDAIRDGKLVVPEEVAVVGVDNDPACCEISSPSLSSVRPNARRVGEEAAALMDRILSGKDVSGEEILIPPIDIVVRQSSDVIAVPDNLVARAVQIIRANACLGLNVEELITKLSANRADLERRFRRHLGLSPHEQIRRVRLARVKQLLLETDWTLERIAEAAGYERPEYLTVQFTRIEGQTPSKWRAANGSAGGKR
jgi:LacI family transcriptional regulator